MRYTDYDYHDMVLDHFVDNMDIEEGITDNILLEMYHDMLANLLDGYHWGDRISDRSTFATLFHQLDEGRYVGIFMGGTLFYDTDDSGEHLYFAICDGDMEQQGKVVAARVSDADEDGTRRLLLDVNTVLGCTLERMR